MAFLQNGLVYPESCIMGFCAPNQPNGTIAAMLFKASRLSPPQLASLYGYPPLPPPGTCFPGYPSPNNEFMEVGASHPGDHTLRNPIALDEGVVGSTPGSSRDLVPVPKSMWRGECRQLAPLQLCIPGTMFSQFHLDMALYGYANSTAEKRKNHSHSYALTGIKSTQLSYGIDRLLGTEAASGETKPRKEENIDAKNLSLPDGLGLYRTEIGGRPHYGVICLKPLIPRSTRFGPFRGRLIDPAEVKSHGDNSFLWEVFSHGVLSHFIDGSDCYWMTYVNCARTSDEQNLAVLQVSGNIFYEACKDIHHGSELLVWYGDTYLKFMEIPIALKTSADAEEMNNQDANDGYQCQRCGKVFAYQYYRDKHLKYTRCVDQGDRKFPCHLCTRSFEKRDRLRIHILHVHEKHRPHKCTMCSKSFSQSSSLNKHMRVHSGERPYKCGYCSKAFTASSILRTHVRQHSGEKPFKCKYCGKAFASHAAHDSHVKRTHSSEIACAFCGQVFDDAYLLRIHSCARTGKSQLQLEAEPCHRPRATSGRVTCDNLSTTPGPVGFPSPLTASRHNRDDDMVKLEEEVDVVGVGYEFRKELN